MPILSKAARRPVPLACSATFFGLVAVVAGASGYTLSRHDAFVAGTRWTGGPIWWQVAVGLASLAASVWLWRRAIVSPWVRQRRGRRERNSQEERSNGDKRSVS